MSLSTAQVLAPKTILKAISQLDLPGTALQKLMGWGLSSGNVRRQSGRNFSWDIFNNSRKIATGRDKGHAASRQKAQGVGIQQGTFPRSAETIELLDETLLNQRGIGGPDSQLDHEGQNYLTHQEVYLAQRFTNLIEFQTAAMLRGSYSYTNDGDDLRHGFSGGEETIEFKIPAGNKTQLNMLGGGNILNADWATTSTDIPKHLQNINTAMVQLTGMGLAHVVLTGTGWQYIVNNLKVQAQGEWHIRSPANGMRTSERTTVFAQSLSHCICTCTALSFMGRGLGSQKPSWRVGRSERIVRCWR